ncbi:MAG: NAD(P)-dependent oxidoreductase, partial [Usitatibacteraceae bacterium]
EHAIALLLAGAKSIVPLNARMHSGHWDKATHKSLELGGRTLGLIGLGAIGQRVALVANALGMKVIGYDPFAANPPSVVRLVKLETIWHESDAISLHCPLTDENHQLINATTLAGMKRGVMLVNTARGGLIDEAALLAALRSGQVAYAGLDSFAEEPISAGHPFFGEPNLVLSPHIGGVTGDAYVNMGVAAVKNILSNIVATPVAQH